MWAVLKNRDYFWLWMGNTVSLVGDRVREWAMIYWVYDKSGNSPFVLSLSLFAAMLPNLLLSPVAGVWVDRWDRRRTMLISDLVRGCLSLLLIAAVATGQYWYALGVTFLASCAAQFFSPSRHAMVRRTVGPENLLAANSLAQTTDSVLSLAGPALGTAIFTFLGPQVAFIVDAASYFLSAACIAMVRTS
ncbi:MAG TPA: MFS transporter, partial [Symbiobacteriaceae bacterium]|nr:MFS transporter [Symbiobacteriaceae bacterium]